MSHMQSRFTEFQDSIYSILIDFHYVLDYCVLVTSWLRPCYVFGSEIVPGWRWQFQWHSFWTDLRIRKIYISILELRITESLTMYSVNIFSIYLYTQVWYIYIYYIYNTIFGLHVSIFIYSFAFLQIVCGKGWHVMTIPRVYAFESCAPTTCFVTRHHIFHQHHEQHIQHVLSWASQDLKLPRWVRQMRKGPKGGEILWHSNVESQHQWICSLVGKQRCKQCWTVKRWLHVDAWEAGLARQKIANR